MAVQVSLNQRRIGLNVVVDEQDDLTLCELQAGIARRGRAGLFLKTDSQIGVGPSLLFENCASVVVGVIVCDNDLIIFSGDCLGLNSLDCFGKKRTTVAGWDDDTKLWHEDFTSPHRDWRARSPSGA